MGKKRDDQFAEDDASPRKHKKHKKKHKHKRVDLEGCDDIMAPDITSPKTSIKLKLKIGGETLGTKKYWISPSVTTIEHTSHSSFDDPQDDPQDDPIINVTDDLSWDSASVTMTPQGSTTTETKVKGSSSDDEEKKWLDALEAGTLDDFGEIPKTRDPALLTARQRALLHGHQVELQQLPSGYKTVELTEEQKQRRQQRAKKRRQQAHEKREKDKKQTLERLLKKQETKTKGTKGRGSKQSNVPRVRYVSNQSGVSLSFPQGHHFPIPHQVRPTARAATRCGVEGCSNAKKYCCSRTQVPLCSLQCYQRNRAMAMAAGTWLLMAT